MNHNSTMDKQKNHIAKSPGLRVGRRRRHRVGHRSLVRDQLGLGLLQLHRRLQRLRDLGVQSAIQLGDTRVELGEARELSCRRSGSWAGPPGRRMRGGLGDRACLPEVGRGDASDEEIRRDNRERHV